MARVIFPIKRSIKCPECGKYVLPIDMIILEQSDQKTKYQCSYCGNIFEVDQGRPDFYTIV